MIISSIFDSRSYQAADGAGVPARQRRREEPGTIGVAQRRVHCKMIARYEGDVTGLPDLQAIARGQRA